MEEVKPHIVIDNGSGYCKAGFSGEAIPIADFPTCVGYPKNGSNLEKKEFFVGAKAMGKCNTLTINYPIVRGDIKNFDDMEKIWEHIFSTQLRVNQEEHNVMLTETPTNLKIFKEKTIQVMFETFNVAGFYLVYQTFLSLNSSGKFTGVILSMKVL